MGEKRVPIQFDSIQIRIQDDSKRPGEREREREKERKKRPKSTPGNDGVVPFRETTNGAEEKSRRVCGGVVAPGPYFFTPAVSASFSGSVQIL